MEPEDTKSKGITWRRGLNRLFIVLSVVWILFVFVGYPIIQVHQAQKFANFNLWLKLINPAATQEEKAGREAEQKILRYEASLPYVYKYHVFPDIHLYFLVAVLPPVILYLLVWPIIVLVGWLYRGFRAT